MDKYVELGSIPLKSSSDAAAFGILARNLRQQRGLTLDALAQMADLSKGHLSRFERGEKALSVAALMRLASALDTSVAMLLGEQMDEDRIHLVRKDERTPRKADNADGGYGFAMLSRSETECGPNVFVIDLPGAMHRVSEAHHGGEEAILVLMGAVDVDLGSKTYRLEQGDYLQFPGHVRHVLNGVADINQILVMVAGA